MSIGGKKRNTWASIPQNPIKPDGIVENVPVITKDSDRRAVVDTRYTPLSNLILHTSGDMWKADYYRQLVGRDDKLRPLEIGSVKSEQQYEEILGLELRVDDPLVSNQDLTTKSFEVTGSGTVTHGVIPNYGDMFVADIGDGEAGLFTITSSERASDMKAGAYLVRWRLVGVLENEWKEDLESKVVKTIHYVRELVELLDTPFMTPSAYASYVTLQQEDKRLIQFFDELFWSREVQSLKIPKCANDTYDPFHAAFCKEIGLSSIQRPIVTYDIGLFDTSVISTIWDLFRDMDSFRFPLITQHMQAVGTKSIKGTQAARTVRWTTFKDVLVPHGPIDTPDNLVGFKGHSVTLSGGVSLVGHRKLPETIVDRFNLPDVPMFKLVSFMPYVLSTEFYDKYTQGMSILELMLFRVINHEYVPPEIVHELVKNIYTEPKLSVFYYTPLLLVLIEYCKRGGK